MRIIWVFHVDVHVAVSLCFVNGCVIVHFHLGG
jgi:hypothetical protein